MTATRPLILGLRANWQQFALLIAVNAFVGGMVAWSNRHLHLSGQGVDVARPRSQEVEQLQALVAAERHAKAGEPGVEAVLEGAMAHLIVS